MKTLFYVALVTFTFAAPSYAASKICFYSHGDSGVKGDKFTAEVSETSINVKADDSSAAWGGKFTRKKSDAVVNGKDGNTYLDFSGGTSGDDGCSEVLADEELVKPSGKGDVKFRCRGEGFSNEVFFCKPDKE